METRQDKYIYPVAAREDVVDNYHDTLVEDPYRWLEDDHSPETMDWMSKQNQLSLDYLDVPVKEQIHQRLKDLWDCTSFSQPMKRENRVFYWKNQGLSNHPLLYMYEEGVSTIVLNPNDFSDDGTVAITFCEISRTGKLVAYGVSQKGSDRKAIRIRNIETGRDLDDILHWIVVTKVAWKKDDSGFYYSRHPNPELVDADEQYHHHRVFFHKIGTSQAKDLLIYKRPDAKALHFFPRLTHDERYLTLKVMFGAETNNRFYYADLEDPERKMIRFLDQSDACYSFIDNDDNLFYFKTNLDAPHQKIVAIDIHKPEREHWIEIVPEQKDVIFNQLMIKDHLVLIYNHNAHHLIRIFKKNGEFVKDIQLPIPGSIAQLSGQREEKVFFFSFNSFLQPTQIYYYNLSKDKLKIILSPNLDFDFESFTTHQVFYTSKDGTKVPMFLTHRKDIVLDGNNPVLMYGYGGFGDSRFPSFSKSRSFWIEQGGIYVLANVRGGGEFGESWHKAGMLENKQNVFDDFTAAAQHLIKEKYTCPELMTVTGGSNGGLLVSACMEQHPEVFGAVICLVPMTDMLRYHKFTVGHYWIPEYGSSEVPHQFKFLYSYSPLHNVKKDQEYPPIFVRTADHDDRVLPAHANKFVATLQAACNYTSKNPILLRIDTETGHGEGKPTEKEIEEEAEIYTFLFKTLGLEFKEQVLNDKNISSES